MKRTKILLKDKTILLFCIFVMGSGVASAYQETNSNNINPVEDTYEIVFHNN